MAEIKFYKTTDLPNSPTPADDGVYFVLDDDTKVLTKLAVISNGAIKEYTPGGGGEIDWGNLTDKTHLRYDSSLDKIIDSNIEDTTTGSEVKGRLDSYVTVERRTSTSTSSSFTIDLSNPSGHYDLTLTGNTTIGFSNMIGANQSTVITLVVGGDYSLLFPSWLKPMPNNDDYYSDSASDVNLITILIRNGGGSPQGIYSLTNVDLT